jgi:putative acetyltransferase
VSKLETLIANPGPFTDRTSLPFICSNIAKVLPQDAIDRIAAEDRRRREDEVFRILDPEAMTRIERALGIAPFSKLQAKEEALKIFDRVTFDPDAYQPINQVLNALSASRRWALYLITGFHAVATYTDGHREMIQESAGSLPRSALLGGSSPRLLDIGIGNGNLLAATMATNPKAVLFGVDIAGASQNRSMAVINSIADEVQARYPSHKRSDYGRFGFIRGSASDPDILLGQKFDGVSIVLTLFAVPSGEREQALRIVAEHVNPGGTVTLVDPVPSVGTAANAKSLIQLVVATAFRNNEELTALDVAILTAMNMHNLLKTEFLSAEQQTQLGQKVGLVPCGPAKPIYYGIASMQVFEKPWRSESDGTGRRESRSTTVKERSEAQGQLKQRIEDELRRHVLEEIWVRIADNSDRASVKEFVGRERAAAGIRMTEGLESDLDDIEREYQAKGGFLFLLVNADEKIVGTFAFAPTSPEAGEVRKVYFAKPYRSRGFGGKMLDALLRHAANRGFREVYAETNRNLQSAPMFEHAGFTPTQPLGTPKPLSEDGFWLVKRFPQ